MFSLNHATTGVLISNVGTPQALTIKAVRKYLSEFLSDPYVVQIPKPIWWLVLNGIILRTRPRKSAKLYQKIWTPLGSPLLVTSEKLVQKLQNATLERGYEFKYSLGMRYGEPSLKQALLNLKQRKISKLIILPLYPQYSSTTTASTYAEIKKQLSLLCWQPELLFLDHYASNSSYIFTLVTHIQNYWQHKNPGQKLLFSFHGIPNKHILNGDPYYDQCLKTAQAIALQLGLKKNQWLIVFQSRFGGEKWLQPYCNQTLKNLAKEGYKDIDVICPGFPIDCLETLEEMAITNKKIFLKAGGKTLNYIPALNDSQVHIQLLLNIILSSTHDIN